MKRTTGRITQWCAIMGSALLTLVLVDPRPANAQINPPSAANPTILQAVQDLQSQVSSLTALVIELSQNVGTTQTDLEGIPHAWARKLPGSERFRLVLDGAGVLDLETGLAWEQAPRAFTTNFADTSFCASSEVGGRRGWRVPSVWEILTLVDNTQSMPALPAGHPFTLGTGLRFWTTTPFSVGLGQSSVWVVGFDNLAGAGTTGPGALLRVWCVRAPGGVVPVSPTLQ